MPIEYTQLLNAPVPLKTCPKCKALFEPFLRGVVQRSKKTFWLRKSRPYCALICESCKEIVGHESPDGQVELLKATG